MPVRDTCLCLFTEMLSNVSIDCTVLSELVGLLELSLVTSLAHRSLCRCSAPQQSRRGCQTDRSLPVGSFSDPSFVFGTDLRIWALYHTWHNSLLVRCAGSGSSSPSLAHLIDLQLDDRILYTVFFMILDCFTSTEFPTCWTCLFTTCSPVHCWIVS